MQLLSKYLKRFSTLTPPNDSIRREAAMVIHEMFGVTVVRKNITMRSGILFITASPILKNEIFLQKNELIKKINTAVGKEQVKDIK